MKRKGRRDATGVRRRPAVTLAFLTVAACVAGTARWQVAGPLLLPSRRQPKSAASVILFVVDDQGFNDFGAESDLAEASPTLRRLANEGIRLTRHYGMHLCTPSRAGLLTGIHPMRLGCQHSMITANEPWGCSEGELLAMKLRRRGYNTGMVGKWHLGHCRESMWPTKRGFDSFTGLLSGFHDYYDHVSEVTVCGDSCYVDLRRGEAPLVDDRHTLDVMQEAALEFVKRSPFFLYVATPTVHEPLQDPPEGIARPNASTPRRRTFAAMTAATDALAAAIADAVDLDSTLFCYLSDNGGAALWPSVGNNWPLRGSKGYYFEGGIRTHAFVRPPGPPQPRTFDGLFSVVDWAPTILGYLGVAESPATQVDGIDQWRALDTGTPLRHELLINADVVDADSKIVDQSRRVDNATWVATGALVVGDLKLVRNARLMPAWPVPINDDANHALYFNWTRNPLQDFLFNLTSDPHESVAIDDADLKAAMLERFNALALAYSRRPHFCDVSDDAKAEAAFDDVGFIDSWLPDVPLVDEDADCPDASLPDIATII